MRVRTRTSPSSPPGIKVKSVMSGTEETLYDQSVRADIPFYSAQAGYTFLAWEQSVLTDHMVADQGRNDYKPIYHERISSAALMEGKNTGLLTYPTPLAPVTIGLTGCVGVTTIPVTGEIPWSDLIVALSEQLDECANSKFMGMVFLKELGETVAMIRNPFNLINPQAIRYFPKGITMAAASAKRSLKNAPNLWLEYRYGWKPLYSDICSFAKAWAKMTTDPAYTAVKTVWKRFTSSKTVSASVLPTLWPQGYNQAFWDYCLSETSTLGSLIGADSGLLRLIGSKCETVGTVYCEQARPLGELANFLDHVEYVLQAGTWQQARDTLWEILPFSFVVDWFINFNNIWRLFADQRLLQVDVRKLGYSTKSTFCFNPETMLCMPWALYRGDSVYWRTNPGLLDPNAHRRVIRGGPGKTINYQRTLGLPANSEEIFKLKGLGALRTVDGLSLFLQRLRYRPKTIYQR